MFLFFYLNLSCFIFSYDCINKYFSGNNFFVKKIIFKNNIIDIYWDI